MLLLCVLVFSSSLPSRSPLLWSCLFVFFSGQSGVVENFKIFHGGEDLLVAYILGLVGSCFCGIVLGLKVCLAFYVHLFLYFACVVCSFGAGLGVAVWC